MSRHKDAIRGARNALSSWVQKDMTDNGLKRVLGAYLDALEQEYQKLEEKKGEPTHGG